MVRFVDRNTILGNERLPNEYKYMKEGLQKAIDTYNLTYIDVPKEKNKEAVDIIQKAFPDKIIETINYDDVAKEGGLLNCTQKGLFCVLYFFCIVG